MNIQKKRNGIVLITAIFLVFLIATLGIGYLALVNNQLELANITLKSAKAFYCAETGIAKAVLVCDDLVEGDTIPDEPADDDEFLVEVKKVEVEDFEGTKTVTIKSTGTWSGFQRIISVDLVWDEETEIITQKDWKEIQ